MQFLCVVISMLLMLPRAYGSIVHIIGFAQCTTVAHIYIFNRITSEIGQRTRRLHLPIGLMMLCCGEWLHGYAPYVDEEGGCGCSCGGRLGRCGYSNMLVISNTRGNFGNILICTRTNITESKWVYLRLSLRATYNNVCFNIDQCILLNCVRISSGGPSNPIY